MNIKNQNWISLTSIQVGGAICLPVLLIGFELARTIGLGAALYAIAIGNAILFAISLIGAQMSAASTLTTAENAEPVLGKKAKSLFAIVMALSMSLWFAIQAQMMAQDLIMGLPFGLNEPLVAGTIAGVIVLCALSGIRGIETLSNLAVPLMIATMALALYQGGGQNTSADSSHFTFSGLSLVLAASIACVVDMPTFFRHATSEREAVKASIATFLVGIPLVEVMGAFLSSTTGAASLIDALYCFDSPLWRVWIMLFILLAGWTTNNANLYSAAMSMKSLMPTLSDKRAIGYLGIVAILFSLCNILGHLALFLDVMGVMVASMGGVIFAGYILQRGTNIARNVVALVMGVSCGLYCHIMQGALTNVPILDALIISSAMTLVLNSKRTVICQKN